MTNKTTLDQLIDELPESKLLAAERFLAYLRDMADPVRRLAAAETDLPQATFPETCPWMVAQVVDENFWPEA